jgi:signal transduction histidine kinase
MLRRGLITLVISLGIAFMLAGIRGFNPVISLIYSLCIGLACWLMMELVMHTLAFATSRGWIAGLDTPQGAALQGATHTAQGHATPWQHWPDWRWVALGTVLGIPLAYTAGNGLGNWITGNAGHHVDAHGWRSFLGFSLMSVMAAFAATYFFYSRQRITQAHGEIEQARRIAAESQLKLIEAQLDPHMLFNTLANLRALIALDAPAAQTLLDHLIDFYRATLQGSRQSWHPLSAEFTRIGDYLALMQVRMGSRLRVSLDLPADLRDTPVPPMLLQPLVENAIVHGLELQPGGGQLWVSAERKGPLLRLHVQDSGMGLRPATSANGQPATHPHPGTGFGLVQVRERLKSLYGSAATLALSARPEGGAQACITLPLLHPGEPPTQP